MGLRPLDNGARVEAEIPDLIEISQNLTIAESEVEITAMRSQGAGGQNVNKVASAIHLRFDIPASSLPDDYKKRLLARRDRRISKEGVLIIKAQRYRTQDKNRSDAVRRLVELIQAASEVPKVRKPTRPSKAAKEKRLTAKHRRGQVKALRSRVTD